MKAIDTRCVNALRVFGAEMITKAKSGHPGIVLGAAPIIHTLYTRHIRVNAEDEKWFNRDRFVLSAGHGSTLLYMMLHLSGFKVSLDDLKNFRQKGSLTPGHPEYGHTSGVEITTGPLGQGVATSVGFIPFLNGSITTSSAASISYPAAFLVLLLGRLIPLSSHPFAISNPLVLILCSYKIFL